MMFINISFVSYIYLIVSVWLFIVVSSSNIFVPSSLYDVVIPFTVFFVLIPSELYSYVLLPILVNLPFVQVRSWFTFDISLFVGYNPL